MEITEIPILGPPIQVALHPDSGQSITFLARMSLFRHFPELPIQGALDADSEESGPKEVNK